MVVLDSGNKIASFYIKMMAKDSKEAINFEKTKDSTIWSTEYNEHMFLETTIILKLKGKTETENWKQ